MYQKRFDVRLFSVSIIRKPPDILALLKRWKIFERGSVFQILPVFLFLQSKIALLAYNLNAYIQTFWKHRYKQYPPWLRILARHFKLTWLEQFHFTVICWQLLMFLRHTCLLSLCQMSEQTQSRVNWRQSYLRHSYLSNTILNDMGISLFLN